MADSPIGLTELYRDETSTLSSIGPLKILRLKGTPLERAKAHGKFLRSHLSTSVLDYFVGKFNEPFAALPKPLRTAVTAGVGALVRGLHRDLPPELRLEIAALAEGAQIDEKILTVALSAPDLGTLMNPWLIHPFAAWARLRFGCTTAATGTRETGFSFARNLDFSGVGSYDAHPLIVSHIPPEGSSELKRISIAADGVHFASISGINERGIGLVIHMNFSKVNTAHSWPLLLIGDWILRQATSLDQAESMLRACRPGPLWTFVFFDMNKGETRACEASRDHFGVRKSSLGEVFAQANHCTAEETCDLEHSPYATNFNSICRMNAAAAGLRAEMPADERRIALAKMLVQSESDRPDEPSLFADIIKPLTIQSMIFERAPESESIDLFLSIDSAPSSSGRYAKLNIQELLSSDLAPFSGHIVDFNLVSAARRENELRLSRAFHLSFDEKRDAEALDQIRPLQSSGILLLKAVLAGRTKQWNEAIAFADEGLERTIPPYIRSSLLWVKVVALDKLGDRVASRSTAQIMSDEAPQNQFWAEAAQRVANGHRPRGHEISLAFDFFAGDLLAPPQAPIALR